MELTLTCQIDDQVSVTCDNRFSHTFDLRALVPNEKNSWSQPPDDPVSHGQAIYNALFPSETVAWHALNDIPERILLITADNTLNAVPWEYAYGPDGFLVLDYRFVRGLPADQRVSPPSLGSGLHIVAVPSNPLTKDLPPLNIDGEWQRLKETLREMPLAITLERAGSPTIEQVRRLVANEQNRVVHFMGYGGQREKEGALLCSLPGCHRPGRLVDRHHLESLVERRGRSDA